MIKILSFFLAQQTIYNTYKNIFPAKPFQHSTERKYSHHLGEASRNADAGKLCYHGKYPIYMLNKWIEIEIMQMKFDSDMNQYTYVYNIQEMTETAVI